MFSIYTGWYIVMYRINGLCSPSKCRRKLIAFRGKKIGKSWKESGRRQILNSVPGICVGRMKNTTNLNYFFYIQGGAEPTDTFQMVIDNIWKQGKICETLYKYVQVCYLFPTN